MVICKNTQTNKNRPLKFDFSPHIRAPKEERGKLC